MKKIMVRHNYVDKHGYEWDVVLYEDIPLDMLSFTEGQSFDGGVTYTVVDEEGNRVGGAQAKMRETVLSISN